LVAKRGFPDHGQLTVAGAVRESAFQLVGVLSSYAAYAPTVKIQTDTLPTGEIWWSCTKSLTDYRKSREILRIPGKRLSGNEIVQSILL
jgi:hypothetical protein